VFVAADLRQKVARPNDGSCDEVWKEQDEEQEIRETAFRFDATM
jgi:hypothetical protein